MKKGSRRCTNCEFYFAPGLQYWGVVWDGGWYCDGECLAEMQEHMQRTADEGGTPTLEEG